MPRRRRFSLLGLLLLSLVLLSLVLWLLLRNPAKPVATASIQPPSRPTPIATEPPPPLVFRVPQSTPPPAPVPEPEPQPKPAPRRSTPTPAPARRSASTTPATAAPRPVATKAVAPSADVTPPTPRSDLNADSAEFYVVRQKFTRGGNTYLSTTEQNPDGTPRVYRTPLTYHVVCARMGSSSLYAYELPAAEYNRTSIGLHYVRKNMSAWKQISRIPDEPAPPAGYALSRGQPTRP